MTQDNKECNDMNSAFEKLRIASAESDRNISDKLDILKPKILEAINQIRQKKKRPDTDSIYDFITRTCTTNRKTSRTCYRGSNYPKCHI